MWVQMTTKPKRIYQYLGDRHPNLHEQADQSCCGAMKEINIIYIDMDTRRSEKVLSSNLTYSKCRISDQIRK